MEENTTACAKLGDLWHVEVRVSEPRILLSILLLQAGAGELVRGKIGRNAETGLGLAVRQSRVEGANRCPARSATGLRVGHSHPQPHRRKPSSSPSNVESRCPL